MNAAVKLQKENNKSQNSFALVGHVNAGAADFVAGAEGRDNKLIAFFTRGHFSTAIASL